MTARPTRRAFLGSTLAGAIGASAAAKGPAPRRILLRSSWQTVNIGDVGHTPGVLRLIEEHLPGVEVTLWPSDVRDGVEPMLRRAFPAIAIAKSAAEKERAFQECDFLLHGSGPSVVGRSTLEEWRTATGKPFGIYGVTLSSIDDKLRSLLNDARFLFLRDSGSLNLARDAKVKAPVVEFAPDGAFACHLRDDPSATDFLRRNGLEDGKFVCCIPRLRNTPYWKIHGRAMDEAAVKKHARNEAMKEHDHAPLREAIIAVVRESGLKVLLCPEDRSQMAVGKEMLLDRLPAEVKDRVVWRERFWLTDEAVSTYVRSAGVFGNEMHSPIMCVGNGVPAIVCRFAEQTNKGLMWRDIGLGDWLFDLDKEGDLSRVAPAVLEMAKGPEAAKAKAVEALAFVKAKQKETMRVVREAVGYPLNP